MTTSQRVYAMDWLRVIAFMLLMVYHSCMFFVGWDFHIINPQKLPELVPLMMFLNQWRLPLLFAVSGAGTWFALGRRSMARFAGERTWRLFLPLVFGMYFVVPPQIYVEYVTKGLTTLSYPAFQLTVFDRVPYPDGGALSWHHLWFVLYLFAISLVSIPLFSVVRSARGSRLLARLRTWIAGGPVRVMLPAAALFAVYMLLDRRWEETHGFFDDPAALVRYGLMFWLGFVVLGSSEIRSRLTQDRAVFLTVTAGAFAIQRYIVSHWAQDTLFTVIYFTCRALYCWGMIVTLFGYACRYLTRSNAFLRYANEAVYPFYILHQSVMMVVYFFVARTDTGPWTRLLLVWVGMFGITALIYELVVRRIGVLRPLFGLKFRPAAARPARPAEAAAVPLAEPAG